MTITLKPVTPLPPPPPPNVVLELTHEEALKLQQLLYDAPYALFIDVVQQFKTELMKLLFEKLPPRL